MNFEEAIESMEQGNTLRAGFMLEGQKIRKKKSIGKNECPYKLFTTKGKWVDWLPGDIEINAQDYIII